MAVNYKEKSFMEQASGLSDLIRGFLSNGFPDSLILRLRDNSIH